MPENVLPGKKVFTGCNNEKPKSPAKEDKRAIETRNSNYSDNRQQLVIEELEGRLNINRIRLKVPQEKQNSAGTELHIACDSRSSEMEQRQLNFSDTKCNTGHNKKFSYGRVRRVSPVPEVSVDIEAQNQSENKSMWGSDSSTFEVFKSRTIIRSDLNSHRKNGSPSKTTKFDGSTQSQQLEVVSCENNDNRRELSPGLLKKNFQTSMSKKIHLEVHGNLQPLPDLEDTHITKPFPFQALPRPRRSLNFTFRWFLRPFGLRPKAKKTNISNSKNIINAVVYKTYFVKIKSETYCSNCRQYKAHLKRSRSSLF